jgi:hypothetical protein
MALTELAARGSGMFESWPCTPRVSQPRAAIEWLAKGVYDGGAHSHIGETIMKANRRWFLLYPDPVRSGGVALADSNRGV